MRLSMVNWPLGVVLVAAPIVDVVDVVTDETGEDEDDAVELSCCWFWPVGSDLSWFTLSDWSKDDEDDCLLVITRPDSK